MVADVNVPDALIKALDGVDGLVSAYLFGSVASGRAHRESDVDVGVLLDRQKCPTAGQRFDVRLTLIGPLQSAVGRDVDLVVLNDAPPQLARHIMTTGQRLVVKDAERDHAQLRVTLSRAADLEPFLRRLRAVKLRALAR
jgi:predicted nucleotidyltransferase